MRPRSRDVLLARIAYCHVQYDLQTGYPPGDNFVSTLLAEATMGTNPFQPGTMAILSLGSPREKLWGAVLALTPEGVTLCGVELASFEDLIAMVKDGEPSSPSVIFFPMHRVERMELDLPDGGLPSLSQRFTSKTGLDPSELFLGKDREHFTHEAKS